MTSHIRPAFFPWWPLEATFNKVNGHIFEWLYSLEARPIQWSFVTFAVLSLQSRRYFLCDLNHPWKTRSIEVTFWTPVAWLWFFCCNGFILCEVGNLKSGWSKPSTSYYSCLFLFLGGSQVCCCSWQVSPWTMIPWLVKVNGQELFGMESQAGPPLQTCLHIVVRTRRFFSHFGGGQWATSGFRWSQLDGEMSKLKISTALHITTYHQLMCEILVSSWSVVFWHRLSNVWMPFDTLPDVAGRAAVHHKRVWMHPHCLH